jgi:hypothetical protein
MPVNSIMSATKERVCAKITTAEMEVGNLLQPIPRGCRKTACPQLCGDESECVCQLTHQILIGRRHGFPSPHRNCTPPGQHPQIAAGMVEWLVQIGERTYYGQVAASERGVTNNGDSFGGSLVESSQILLARSGSVQHRVSSVLIVRGECRNRCVEGCGHLSHHSGGHLARLA